MVAFTAMVDVFLFLYYRFPASTLNVWTGIRPRFISVREVLAGTLLFISLTHCYIIKTLMYNGEIYHRGTAPHSQ